MSRLQRKDEHLRQSLSMVPREADFADISFIHNCLPNLDFNEVKAETKIMGRTFRSPLFLNAVTGGTLRAKKVNEALAGVAAELELPMAVGSQMAALESRSALESFTVVRQNNPAGAIWANIGSYADAAMAKEAIEMVSADAIQIHLNVPQELFMKGGDRSFKGILERVASIVESVEVPVIAKEVGFGVAAEQAEQLLHAGVKALDIGGRGGTNFLYIESRSSGRRLNRPLLNWGLPTALSLLETAPVVKGRADLFAAGGVNTAMAAAKSLAIGACAVGMAGMPVYLLLKWGRKALVNKLRAIERDLQAIMLMVGASSIAELQQVPLVITGRSAEWMQRRGMDPDHYARRASLNGQV